MPTPAFDLLLGILLLGVRLGLLALLGPLLATLKPLEPRAALRAAHRRPGLETARGLRGLYLE
eukprot:8275455-Alexandrium_andersonii.AAC.1